jgi:hypothetical protein
MRVPPPATLDPVRLDDERVQGRAEHEVRTRYCRENDAMRPTKRNLALAALSAGVAAGVGVHIWALDRRAYDDDTALAGWADRLAHPPASLEVPVDITLPTTSTGRPLRRAAPIPVDTSLHLTSLDVPDEAVDPRRIVTPVTTSELMLSVSKRSFELEGRQILPVPADPTRGFDARYKHAPTDLALLDGAVLPLAYASERARKFRWELRDQAPEKLLVMVDRSLPCRLLAEVLIAARNQRFVPHLLGNRGGSVVDIGISESVELDWLLVVTIEPDTFELALPDERGEITCERGRVDERNGSRFVTITRSEDGRDFERLSDCAGRIEKAFHHELVFGAAPAATVSVQTLVSTYDALRNIAPRDVKVDLRFEALLPPRLPLTP